MTHWPVIQIADTPLPRKEMRICRNKRCREEFEVPEAPRHMTMYCCEECHREAQQEAQMRYRAAYKQRHAHA